MEIRPIILRMIAMVAGRAFVGPQLNRTESWINQMIDFTIDIFQGGQKLKEWHWTLRPLAQWIIPEMHRVRDHHVEAVKYLEPTIRAGLLRKRLGNIQKRKMLCSGSWTDQDGQRAPSIPKTWPITYYSSALRPYTPHLEPFCTCCTTSQPGSSM